MFTPKEYATTLYDALSQSKESNHDIIMDNFVKVLTHNGDLSKAESIFQIFADICSQKDPAAQAQVHVAHKGILEDAEWDALNKAAQMQLEKQETDSDIVGGVIIKTPNHQLDLSVKAQLDNLRKALLT